MNRSMEAKYAKAKKEAIKQMTEDSYNAACATRVVKQCNSVIWNMHYKPYSICNN